MALGFGIHSSASFRRCVVQESEDSVLMLTPFSSFRTITVSEDAPETLPKLFRSL